jgi:endonuclease-3
MPRTSKTKAAEKERACAIYDRLIATYPDAGCSLNRRNAFELLIATILAAQCTDARVNIVTKTLFKKYRTPEDYVKTATAELEEDIRSTGFYRMKAKNIQGMCRKLIEEYAGKVPNTMEALTALPGVGRKTANVVLGDCFGVQGVVVDTHCTRLANRMGFTRNEDPIKIERDLMKIWPEDRWSLFSHLMVFHGRAVCAARAPRCSECPLCGLCPFPNTPEGKKLAR